MADLPRLALASQIFKETMRLYPPAYMVGRQAERELWLGEARIPRGAFVFVNIFGLHRRPDLFADPLAFSPARFSGAGERALPRGAYIPFGGGPRICIGNHFAMMEGTLLLAHLAQRVELTGSGQPVAAEPLLTLRPRGGLPMTVRRRARLIAPESRGQRLRRRSPTTLGGQDRALGRAGARMALCGRPGSGGHRSRAGPRAHGARDHPGPLEPRDDPGQGALAEVHAARQIVHAAVGGVGGFFDQPVEHLELADPELVLLAEHAARGQEEVAW